MKQLASESYDVAIIGLGPAGATLARLLSPTLRVIAIDKKHTGADSFQKPCGGLLSTDAQKALAGFDLNLPKDVLVDPQIFTVKTIDVGRRLIRHYQRFYLNLDRHKFDLWLQSLIPAQVSLHTNALCTALSRHGSGFSVSFLENGETHTVRARFLVGADGANSRVRRTFFPHHRIRTYLSIQQWFRETHPAPFYSCIFDPRATDCCAWSISKDRQFLFGGAYPLDHARARFEAQKKRLAAFGFRFGDPLKTEACLVLRPASAREICCGADGVFLIGEAAGFISPSSLEGISYAIQSAKALHAVLSRPHGDLHRRYRRKTLPLRLKLLGKLAKSPFLYQPTLRRIVLQSGLQSVCVQADA